MASEVCFLGLCMFRILYIYLHVIFSGIYLHSVGTAALQQVATNHATMLPLLPTMLQKTSQLQQVATLDAAMLQKKLV